MQQSPFWERMSMDDYAHLELAVGAKLVRSGGIWWRSVRPLFFRPVLPFIKIDPRDCSPPLAHRLGGVQYAVTDERLANSRVNVIAFEGVHEYTLSQASRTIRDQVRKGNRALVVRPIDDAGWLESHGHGVYLSFLNRTAYKYRDDRRDPRVFVEWVRTLYRFPVRVLGAFDGEQLVAVSVSYLVEDSLCYGTFFSKTDSLKLFVSDVMLHFVREQAARSEGVSRIYVGMAGMSRGLDTFYQLRGANTRALSARLEANRLALKGLELFFPSRYRQLIGMVESEGSSHA